MSLKILRAERSEKMKHQQRQQIQIATNALRNYLGENQSAFQSTPSILISSTAPPAQGPTSNKKVLRRIHQDANAELFRRNLGSQIEKCHFTLRLEHQLRTVSLSHSAAYPTVSDVRSAMALMSRSGCDSIIAVGSGAAMDLAKAVHALQASSCRLVLIPQTLGAVLASTANETLLFCPNEDTLLPLSNAVNEAGILMEPLQQERAQDSTAVLIDPHTVVLPQLLQPINDRTIASIYDAVLAALVISLDGALHSHFNTSINHQKAAVSALNHYVHCSFEYSMKCLHKLHLSSLTKSDEDQIKQDVLQALIHAGPLLAFNDDAKISSLPYIVSSSLLPQYFPHGNWLSFVSSILPGILTLPSSMIMNHGTYNMDSWNHMIQQISSTNHWDLYGCRMASLAEGTPSYDACLDRIASQAMLLGFHDIDYDILQHVLIQSLNK